MNNTLQKILRKVDSVQVGLVRVENQNEKMLLQARAGASENLLNCIVTKPNAGGNMVLGKVNLIQKDKEDYLYITCNVKEQTQNKQAVILSMEIVKASWFTRRTKGSVTWLQQKYTYDAIEGNLDIAS